MEAQWHYTDQGQRLGPVSSSQLKQLATSGRLQPSDLVWKEGMAQWVAASQVKGLFSAAQAPTPGSASPPRKDNILGEDIIARIDEAMKVYAYPRQEPADGEVQFRRLRAPRGHPRSDRRPARHRPQQDHGHRRGDRHHRQLQFHQERRGEQRREPAGHPLHGTGDKYTANWKAHADHSEPYDGKEKGYSETHRPTGQADPVAPAATPTSEGYVASKNSAVFHKADCKSAAKISEKNLVQYATRDEAIQAGKKPCHECNP